MAQEPRNEPAPAAPPADEPEWARSLRETIEALPGKLRATVTDDDRRGIAEHVHGLFEQSGAFEKHEPPPEDEPAPSEPAPSQPADVQPETHRPGLAERVFGTGL